MACLREDVLTGHRASRVRCCLSRVPFRRPHSLLSLVPSSNPASSVVARLGGLSFRRQSPTFDPRQLSDKDSLVPQSTRISQLHHIQSGIRSNHQSTSGARRQTTRSASLKYGRVSELDQGHGRKCPRRYWRATSTIGRRGCRSRSLRRVFVHNQNLTSWARSFLSHNSQLPKATTITTWRTLRDLI